MAERGSCERAARSRHVQAARGRVLTALLHLSVCVFVVSHRDARIPRGFDVSAGRAPVPLWLPLCSRAADQLFHGAF